MRKHLTTITHLLGLSVLLFASFMPAAMAATTPTTSSGQALEIAPPLIYLNVNPGQTVQTQVLIRDVSNSNVNVTGQVNDFVASGEDGTPKVLLDQTTKDPYSLKDWVVTPTTLQLIPRQIKTLAVTLHIPDNASPGGHYGVIRFTATAPALNGGNGVALSASIGALMLVTVSGKITESMSVQEFSVNHSGKNGTLFQSGPVNFVERLKNTGNVHLQPSGQVVVTDMFGHKVGAVNVNLPPGNVLPDSVRKFSQPFDSTVIGNRRLFGHYTAKLTVSYGSPKKTLTSSLGFWVIPFKIIGIIIAALIIGFFGLRYSIRRYNQAVLRRAGRQSPPNDKK
jgi:hypothetical protein